MWRWIFCERNVIYIIDIFFRICYNHSANPETDKLKGGITMALDEFRRILKDKAQEQIDEITKQLEEAAKKSEKGEFVYRYSGKLYPGVEKFFKEQGLWVKSTATDSEHEPQKFYVEFKIPEGFNLEKD